MHRLAQVFFSSILLVACAATAEDTVKVEANADGSTELTNPYEASGDTTEECYAWAADKQCPVNPAFMHSSCKYSCWEWYQWRAKQYPDYKNIDRRMDCHQWAQDGECSKNPVFMKENCPESCKMKGYDPPPPPPEESKKKKKKSKKGKKKQQKTDGTAE